MEIDPKPFCYSMNMSGQKMCIQEDANELLKKLVDYIEQVCLKAEQSLPQNEIEQYQKIFDSADCKPLSFYKQIFEGTQTSKILCTKCGNTSETQTPFTDFMIPIKQDYFECLAALMAPEEIDGYKCEKCQKEVRALKFIAFKSVPQLAIMTLQRFGYDMYADEYKKDSNPVNCPIALDFYKLGCTDFQTFSKGDLNFDERVLGRLVEYLKISMMPWNYFKIEDQQLVAVREIASATVFKQLAADKEYLKYIQKYYVFGKCNAFNEECEDSDYFQAPKLQEVPPSLYTLASIVCHMGSLNRGHYYALVNKVYFQDGEISCELWEANDEQVFRIQKPVQMLQFIAGKVSKFAKSEQDQNEKNAMFDYGNTGYMYFYERLSNIAALEKMHFSLSPKIKEICEQKNLKLKEELSLFNANTVSNLRNDGQPMTCGGQYKLNAAFAPVFGVPIAFDYRKTGKELIHEYVQQLRSKKMLTEDQMKELKLENAKLYKLKLHKRIFDSELERTIVDQDKPLETDFSNFKEITQYFVEFECPNPYVEGMYVHLVDLKVANGEIVHETCLAVPITDAAYELSEQIYRQKTEKPTINQAILKLALGLQTSQEEELNKFVQKTLLFDYSDKNYTLIFDGKELQKMQIAKGELFFFESLQVGLPALVCPAKVQLNESKSAVADVSLVLQCIEEQKSAFKIAVYDEELDQIHSFNLKKSKTGKDIFDEVSKLIGETDFGYTAEVCVIYGQGHQSQKKALFQLDKKYFDYSLEKLHKYAVSQSSKFIQILDGYFQVCVKFTQPKATAIQFIVNQPQQTYSVFKMAQHHKGFEDGQELAQVWNQFTLQQSTILQFKEFPCMTKPADQLRFFFLNQEKAAHMQSNGVLYQMMSSSSQMGGEQKLNIKMFKQPFYVYVEEVTQYEQMWIEFAKPKQGGAYIWKSFKVMWHDDIELTRLPVYQDTTAGLVSQFFSNVCGKMMSCCTENSEIEPKQLLCKIQQECILVM